MALASASLATPLPRLLSPSTLRIAADGLRFAVTRTHISPSPTPTRASPSLATRSFHLSAPRAKDSGTQSAFAASGAAPHVHHSPLPSDNPEIREAIRALCSQFPAPYWREMDRHNRYPTEFVTALTEAGWLSCLIPEEYGGSGLPLSAAAAIMEEIHRSGCSGGAAHAQMYIMGTILRNGSEAQKKKFLPEIAAGRLRLQAFGVTEPTAGTDTTSIRTTAIKDPNDPNYYIVSGQKIWTSRAEHSDLMLLLCRTTPIEKRTKKTEGLSVLLVDMQEALKQGTLTIRPIEAMINHATTEVFFDNMRIPAENLIGEEGKGFRYILDGMNAERILIAAEAIGDGRWFVDKAVAYAKERVVFGKPIGSNQGIQFPIAEAYAEVEAAASMVREAAAKFDSGRKDVGAEANMAKMLAGRASWKAGDTCMQTHGGFGFAVEYDIERKFRETRLFRTAPISDNLILSFIGEHVLKMPKSY
ncbi:acyl-CoA dehydrogenase NM domain-like protein [Gonapodya prolifera JEL478]|uniref:Acyl-CoA dehydrogenase NM domain-like protein n=1 Tax=Gonapodya prolifera (strain JEL478) TaxID=1344416 RepID=A0A139AAZ0_GONPJ|nr:acyl-CoA dehydrogenase NM domain-like protein [Gonapodya prolifera JEL478]|eukprot:KXS13992.1 acyl-CoA dehydrogenase NM domain-like protein [Gonapodya prolifera JEL478]